MQPINDNIFSKNSEPLEYSGVLPAEVFQDIFYFISVEECAKVKLVSKLFIGFSTPALQQVAGLQAEINGLRNREKVYWIVNAIFFVWIVVLTFYVLRNCSPKEPSKNPTGEL
ncbi:hypothetical protein DdX_19367 [Ditylenchus destructor]|uniref:F-box domain-containing protein n=1 Tax=Ditylenchus destructor TaxID=166010 RepID=A0AAD4QXG4_9BILA|nr:hypothetical protein DdX_19367 [Ditylenchus destructor]